MIGSHTTSTFRCNFGLPLYVAFFVVLGSSRVESIGGHKYFVSMINYYSRMTWVIIMKHKSEAFKNFKQLKALVENQAERKIKRLRIDNGLNSAGLSLMSSGRMKGLLAIILLGIRHNRTK